MNILQINKFFYIRDGTSRYFLNLSDLLRKKGHRILHFSMKSDRNMKSQYSKYFIDNISFNKNKLSNISSIISGCFYSTDAKNKIKMLLDENKVDLVHLHSIYHYLSPSILLEIKKRKIPVVMTAHDFHLVAPNYLLYHSGKVCEITKPDRYYKAIAHKCVRDSYSLSLMETAEKYFNKFIIKERNLIDSILVPSLFVKNKFIEYGYPADKLTVLPFFTDLPKNKPKNQGMFILYFGGLFKHKGVDFLIRVMKDLPQIPCLIAGEGPEEYYLKNMINKNKVKNVKLLGYQNQSELDGLISSSQFTVMPSLWYEGFGMVNIEANAYGKPVVASKIGGIQEVIKDRVNGLLCEPGNRKDFSEKILTLWKNNNLRINLGRQGRKIVEAKFNRESHFRSLTAVYKRVINQL